MSPRQPITEEQGVHKEWYAEAREMTLEKLPEFLRKLTEDYGHDYGTICHACAAAAVGAAWAVERSPEGGITGFQAGAIFWEFWKHWLHEDGPARILKYSEALYPQYESLFTTISPDSLAWLKEQATKKLADGEKAADAVLEHWRFLANGGVPFGLRVEDR